MSGKPVTLSFTGVSARPGPAPPAQPVSNDPHPPRQAAAQTSDLEPRLRTRADLASIYSALLGQPIPSGDIYERMLRFGEGNDISPERLAEGMGASGLLISVRRVASAAEAEWLEIMR